MATVKRVLVVGAGIGRAGLVAAQQVAARQAGSAGVHSRIGTRIDTCVDSCIGAVVGA